MIEIPGSLCSSLGMKLRHRVAITRGPGRRCRNSGPEDQPSVVRNSQQNSQCERARKTRRPPESFRGSTFFVDETLTTTHSTRPHDSTQGIVTKSPSHQDGSL